MNDRGGPPQARIFDKSIAGISRKFLADFSDASPPKIGCEFKQQTRASGASPARACEVQRRRAAR
jgi:hypothetical protein